jgi:hypothetical protein
MYYHFCRKLQKIVKEYYSGKIHQTKVEKEVKKLVMELIDFNIEICDILVKIQKETSKHTFKDTSLFVFKYCLSPLLKDNENIFHKYIINKKITNLLKKYYNYFLLFAFYLDNISQHRFLKTGEKIEDYLMGFKALKRSLR